MSQQTRTRIAEWADLVGAEVPDGVEDDDDTMIQNQPLSRPN